MIGTALLATFVLLVSASAGVGAQPASAGATKPDALLMRDLAQANLAEIVTGKLAMEKGRSPLVRQYARQMVEDHSQLLDEGQRVAAARGLPMPNSPDIKHDAARKKLETLSGEAFDRAYMEQMVRDHANTLELLQRASDSAKDPALRTQAQRAMPHVQAHLDVAKRIISDLKTGG